MLANTEHSKRASAPRRNRGRCWSNVLLTFVLISAVASTVTVEAQGRRSKKPLDPQTRDKIDDVINDIVEPEAVLTIPRRQSKIIRTSRDIKRVSAADPAVIEIVAFDTREIEIIGKETGSTSMTLWLGDGVEAETLSILVKVGADKLIDEERRLEYGELQDMINEMFPGSKVRLFPVADKVIVKGQAKDGEQAQQIMSIVRQNGGGVGGFGFGGGFGGGGNITAQGAAAQPFPDGSTLPASTVISMLMIPGEQQVMLKVRLAELNRDAVRTMGVDLDANIYDFFVRTSFGGGGNLFFNGTFTDSNFSAAVNALESHGYLKILAQPNLVTLSGQPATFLAGGEFAVPTVVGLDGVGAATTTFRGFGARLSFTPTIIDKDRIRLQVNPEFSQLNGGNAVGGIPGLDTRAASTTVDMREGQVLAIAGLIQDVQSGTRNRLPFFGAMPVIGPLFNGKSVSRNETELVIIVTPEIVSALDPKDAPALLPGMEVTEPNDLDFYFHNRIEGRADDHHRSTVWAKYRDMIMHPRRTVPSYQQAEGYYMHGPSGLSY